MSYQNNVIYKIVCKDDNIKDIYIGSTTNIGNRRREHKSRCSKGYTYKLYEFIRDNGGWDNWELIEIEKFPCETKKEAFARENELYKLNNATLNFKKPQPTNADKLQGYKEYNKRTRDKGWLKKYRQTDKFKEYEKEYKKRKFICSCGKALSNAYKTRHLRNIPHESSNSL